MSKELVISSNRHETRVALLEDDQLVEVYFQRANEYSLAGSIHKGRVTRVLPGMQSAFVDLGLERDTFLYVSDFLEEEHEDIDRVTGDERPPRESGRDRDRDRDRDRERRPAMRPPQEPPRRSAAPASAPAPASLPQPARAEQTPRLGGNGRDERPRKNVRRNVLRTKGRGSRPPRTPLAPPPQSRTRIPRIEICRGRAGCRARCAARRSSPPIAEASRRRPTPQRRADPGGNPAGSTGRVAGQVSRRSAAARGTRGMPGRPPCRRRCRSKKSSTCKSEQVSLRGADPLSAGERPAGRSRALRAGRVACFRRNSRRQHISAPPPLPAEAVSAQEAADLEDAAQSGPVTAPMLDEDEDLDIQAMILGEVGVEESTGWTRPQEETAEADLEGEAGASKLPPRSCGASAAEPATGTAEVRERGGRFPHRVSRRKRRRGGRGGDRIRITGARVNRVRVNRPRRLARESLSQREPAWTPPRRRPARDRERVLSAQVQQISIADLLKEGQEIIVQIAKEPLGQKGARITSHIALPGRFVVYMPTLEHMGVSRKIASDEERFRLKRILQGKRPGPVGGFITRTAAEGRSEEEIAGDMEFLYNLWAGHPQQGRQETRAGAAASRSRYRAAHPARPAGRQLQGHLDRQRRNLRERPAVRGALPARRWSAK